MPNRKYFIVTEQEARDLHAKLIKRMSPSKELKNPKETIGFYRKESYDWTLFVLIEKKDHWSLIEYEHIQHEGEVLKKIKQLYNKDIST